MAEGLKNSLASAVQLRCVFIRIHKNIRSFHPLISMLEG
jgi:hypothetical protein